MEAGNIYYGGRNGRRNGATVLVPQKNLCCRPWGGGGVRKVDALVVGIQYLDHSWLSIQGDTRGTLRLMIRRTNSGDRIVEPSGTATAVG